MALAFAKECYFNTPHKIATCGRLCTLLKQYSKSQPKLACESVWAFSCAQQEWSGFSETVAHGQKHWGCQRFDLHAEDTYIDFLKWLPYKIYTQFLASKLGRELLDNNPCPSHPCSQNECQLQDQPTLASKLSTCGDFIEVPSLSALRTKRIGKPCCSASTCRIAAIQERLRHTVGCGLGRWLSSPGHSKPGGFLGWCQCLWAYGFRF